MSGIRITFDPSGKPFMLCNYGWSSSDLCKSYVEITPQGCSHFCTKPTAHGFNITFEEVLQIAKEQGINVSEAFENIAQNENASRSTGSDIASSKDRTPDNGPGVQSVSDSDSDSGPQPVHVLKRIEDLLSRLCSGFFLLSHHNLVILLSPDSYEEFEKAIEHFTYASIASNTPSHANVITKLTETMQLVYAGTNLTVTKHDGKDCYQLPYSTILFDINDVP